MSISSDNLPLSVERVQRPEGVRRVERKPSAQDFDQRQRHPHDAPPHGEGEPQEEAVVADVVEVSPEYHPVTPHAVVSATHLPVPPAEDPPVRHLDINV